MVRFQGPKANGMPELHKLTPYLGILQDRGHQVALVTDGRMSGASGKVPAAIHLTPEALADGPIGKIRDGDIIRLDADKGELSALVPTDEWNERSHATRSSQDSATAWAGSYLPLCAMPSARLNQVPQYSRDRTTCPDSMPGQVSSASGGDDAAVALDQAAEKIQ